MFFTSLVFIIPGIFYLVFAYRDPPRAIEHFFRVDSLFIFFPEHNRVRIGRTVTGAFLVLFGVVMVVWHALYTMR
jgi:hypothetical protein